MMILNLKKPFSLHGFNKNKFSIVRLKSQQQAVRTWLKQCVWRLVSSSCGYLLTGHNICTISSFSFIPDRLYGSFESHTNVF